MSPRTTPNPPGPASARPGTAPTTSSLMARLPGRLWANRPSLGTLAYLLAWPGVLNVLLDAPLWLAAAVHWSLWLLLLVAMSIIEARRIHRGRGTGEEDR
ncbi:hypothetical protein [Actinomadura geliboluensis]|uniref:hypothetical protein n=1 Tax=Actinomadura geliboluensis TaxID=882440 RepID=UPI0026056EC4|nr:hypothetical protein [Actinomadura geliboluensis]